MKTLLKKISEACRELGVTRQTLYNWNNQGKITIVKSPSGSIFVEVNDLYKKTLEFYGNYTIS